MKRTYYDHLELSHTASAEVVRASYRALAKRYHPDHNMGDESSEAKMAQVNVAYSVLSDPDLRQQYDVQNGFGVQKTASEPAKEPQAAQPDAAENQATSSEADGEPVHRPRETERPSVHMPGLHQSSRRRKKSFHERHPKFLGLFVIGCLSISSAIAVSVQLQESWQRQGTVLDEATLREQRQAFLKWQETEEYLTGDGRIQNYLKALRGFEDIAASKRFKDGRAEQRLGEIYLLGLGVGKDATKAFEWFKKDPSIESHYMLGLMYLEGMGVAKNPVLAYKYFNNVSANRMKPRIIESYSGGNMVHQKHINKLAPPKHELVWAARNHKRALESVLTFEQINSAQN